MAEDLVVTRILVLQASPAKVWETLTDPAITRDYMNGCCISSDWRIGAPVVWTNNDRMIFIGSLTDYMPEQVLKFTFFNLHDGSEDYPSNYIHVSYQLAPKNGMTELQVTLTNFGGNDTRAEQVADKWDFEVLPKLKTLAEAPTMAIMH